MNKIPAQKYPKKGILRESAGAARIYEIKMLQKVRKSCNIYLRIKSYIIRGEGKDGSLSN